VRDTRSRILAAAARQLTDVGYSAFTIASVRDALGLSSGSMFHAFASKPALAAAVYVEGMADYQRTATAAITKAPDAERALRAWIASHLHWIEDHRDLARYLFSTLPDEVMAEAARPLAEHNDAFYAALVSLFDAAAVAGLMARLPRPVAQAICIGPAHEYGRQWTRGNATTPPSKVSRTLEDAALAALAATVPSRASSRKRKKETHS
jgi:AcrR family transcriptional regulator